MSSRAQKLVQLALEEEIDSRESSLIFRHRITSHSKETDSRQRKLFSVISGVAFGSEKDPGILYYKRDIFQEDYKMVDMNRSSRKPIGLPLELCLPRQTPKGLSKKKHNHLLMLLQWIPEAFYVFL
ncbi:unnamed protein product [Acanthoscelides obtectus]|uniref:Uncharacterized protein n=1 Tax=Acanthoscelides obtectus TaxID=200917 RepID=A0A9P0NTE9_ACAOB|nr:unnamed protein product [Acanthoscelides obtectus]CAK1628860.1 hypothetical protein AOBTE_LOCUS5436 [Acanthoscelides obtectus]